MKRIMTAVFALAFATSAFAADGAALYSSKCKMCHGPEGKGGAMFKGKIAGMPAAEVKNVIEKGKGKMKPVSTVTGADADAVAQYVSTLK